MVVGSQYGEDKFLQEFFKEEPYGFLVDVGAADGLDNSNSFRLLQRPHWQGVLIEPEPKQFQVLQNRYINRPGIDCVNCGAGREAGGRTFYCAHQVSTFIPTWRDRCIESYGLSYEEKTVDVKPLTKILQELKAPPVIDFLSIDCEGMDLCVLESLNMDLFSPSLICMEGKGHIISGYQEIYRTVGNVFYKKDRKT